LEEPGDRGLVYGYICSDIIYEVKPVLFVGTSRDGIRGFPDEARQVAGYQLLRVQEGELPDDWRPMVSVGAGAIEIRVQDRAGSFRVIFVAKFEEAVYVLHCFQKKTRQTPKRDIEFGEEEV
jgi:phage-related protein